jgi:hypothetical protein
VESGFDTAGAERLDTAGGIQFEQCADVEFKPYVCSESYIKAEVEPGHQALGIDPEAAVYQADRPDRIEYHISVDYKLDTRVATRQFEAEFDLCVDLEDIGDIEIAAHQQLEAADHAQCLRLDDEIACGIAFEALEDLSFVRCASKKCSCLYLEGVDGLL